MSKQENRGNKQRTAAKSTDFMQTVRAAARKAGKVLSVVWKWVYRLRSIVLAVPVALGAVYLAIYNTAKLPELVGINLQANGEYAMMIERGTAVTVPLVVTGVCLLLMFVSRRTIYPWLISIFSLIVPILIYVTNVFPG